MKKGSLLGSEAGVKHFKSESDSRGENVDPDVSSIPQTEVKSILPARMISANCKHFKTYGNQAWGETVQALARKEYAHFGEHRCNLSEWRCCCPDIKSSQSPS